MAGSSKKRINLIFLFLLLAGIAAFAGFIFKNKSKDNFCDKYNCLSFPGKAGWKLTDVYSDTETGWHGMLSSPDYKVRLSTAKNVDADAANELTKTTLMSIKGLFDTAKNPYAGAISDKIVCPDYLKPNEDTLTAKSGVKISYIQSYLNDRLQYGACTENQISSKVYTGIFYCANTKEWYQIDVITPKDEAKSDSYFKDLFTNAGCN